MFACFIIQRTVSREGTVYSGGNMGEQRTHLHNVD